MGNLWLKIKVWTKVVIFLLLLLYATVFIVQNSSREVQPWLWVKTEPQTSVLILVLCAFLTGVVGTILLRTTFKTLRQIREMQDRGRAERLEREMAEMRTKASMLRAKFPEEPAGTAESELP